MKFEGVMPALITPIKDGKLHVPTLEKLMNDLIDEGADGFYVGGATGEGVTISKEIHKDLTRESVRIAAHRVPVIIHCARMNYDEMIELAKYAEEVGVDCISAIPPLFYKYSEDEIFAYYEKLCQSVKIPVMIYNNPNTGVTFGLDLLEKLFTIPNLTAIKWTNYDYYTVLQFKARVPHANVINGPDELVMMGTAAGCDGCIGTTYNFQQTRIKKIFTAMKEGRVEEARALQTVADKIIAAIIPFGVIKATKLILRRRGYEAMDLVFPNAPYTTEEEEAILAAVRAAGLENI